MDDLYTTKLYGEEDPPMTTHAVGEEDDDWGTPEFTSTAFGEF